MTWAAVVTDYDLRVKEKLTKVLQFYTTTLSCMLRVGCFTCAPDGFELVYCAHGTDESVGVGLLSGKNSLQENNRTHHRWDSHPGICR